MTDVNAGTDTNANSQGQANAVELRARNMGWRPEEEFDGSMANKPKKFLSAEEYVQKVESDIPVLRERNRHLSDQVTTLKTEISQSTGEIKTLNERVTELGGLVDSLHTHNVEIGKRAYDKAKRDLEDVMAEAASEADLETYNKARSQLDELQEHKPADTPPKREPIEQKPDAGQQQASPAVESFVQENPWFLQNDKLRYATLGEFQRVQTEYPAASEEQVLAETKRRVTALYPDDFRLPAAGGGEEDQDPETNPRRETPAAVGGTAPGGKRVRKRSFESLPKEHQDNYHSMARYFKSKGKEYTTEQYMKTYFLENEGA